MITEQNSDKNSTEAAGQNERVVMRKLGNSQRGVLDGLLRSDWSITGFNYWSWNGRNGTIAILESLKRRGLVNLNESIYSISDEGRKHLDA